MFPAEQMKIVGLQLGMFSAEQTRAGSVVEVKTSSVSERVSLKGSVHDPAMGVYDQSRQCPTCHSSMINCTGHGGHTELWWPVPNPFVVEILRKVTEAVCVCCGDTLYPMTAKFKAELLSLPAKKRLIYAAKKAHNILFCGQIQQHQLQKDKERQEWELKQKETNDAKEAKEREEQDAKDAIEDADETSEDEESENEEGEEVLDEEEDVSEEVLDEEEEEEEEEEQEEEGRPKKSKKHVCKKRKITEKKIAIKKPSFAKKRHQAKHLEGELDPKTFKTMGCGAPVGEYTRDNLKLKAKFCLPWKGDPSKKNWPVHNSWRIYETLRYMSAETQKLLGFDYEFSPIRALFFKTLPVPATIVRRKKDDPKKSGSNQDDNTQAIREIVSRKRKLLQKLESEGLTNHSMLGSVNRTIEWYFPPQSNCTCPKARKCVCKAAARTIVCNELVCTDPDVCHCIPKEFLDKIPKDVLKEDSKDLKKDLEKEPLHEEKEKKSMPPPTNRKSKVKSWRELLSELEDSITTYLIGDINKKGAGRKDGKQGVAPWAAATGAANALNKKDKCFAARFVGKRGRIRGTMYGKRCDKTARTVGSGDLYQRVEEIGIPKEFAETLTVRESFREFNASKMMDLLRCAQIEYVTLNNGDLLSLRFLNRDSYAPPIGAMCERHISNGDIVSWNRQPTLHKPSIQGARARILRGIPGSKPRRTIAINHSLTTCTNADFDGDEFNMYLSWDQESRAETSGLMSAPEQIRSQQGDAVIIGLVQNARLALFLITDPQLSLSLTQYQQLLLQFGNVTEQKHIQKMFQRGLMESWPKDTRFTGLQVISKLLPLGVFYRSKSKKDPAIIVDSVLVSGRLTGKDVGTGESGNLVHCMVQDLGEEVTMLWLSGIQRVLNYYLMSYGFTMGKGDYEMQPETKRECSEIIEKARHWCDVNHGEYDMRKTNAQEQKIQCVLERSRDLVLRRLLDEVEHKQSICFARRNGVQDLIDSLAKGKTAHLMQMGAIVGQQMPIGGRVIGNVAHFNVTMDTPDAHGYVPQNYRDGLSPWAFFCAAIGGREGLVHTGSSVPQVGYFQKRLGTCMSDLHAKTDGTIRDSRGGIVQWQYGEDARDPSFMESNDASHFLTPFANADPELKALQLQLLQSRTKFYDLSRFLPERYVAPINFKRLLERSSPFQKGFALTQTEIGTKVNQWFKKMENEEKLLRPKDDLRYNPLLYTLIKDALSCFNLTKLKFTETQLQFVFQELQRCFAKSGLVAGEGVGTIAGQSMGEPATQTTLNLFHVSGSQNVIGTPIGRMNDAVNACKKPLAATMCVFVKEQWKHSKQAVSFVANLIPERRLVDFLVSMEPIMWSQRDPWCTNHLELQSEKAKSFFRVNPIIKLQFNSEKSKGCNLNFLEIQSSIQSFFKKGLHMMSSGSYGKQWIIYIVIDYGMESDKLSDDTLKTMSESSVTACLQEVVVRGISKVSDAVVVAIESKSCDPLNMKIENKEEWGIMTQGSNLEGLLNIPYVDFERCATSYVHDVYKMLGIEGARRWLDENIEDLVRSCQSRVDVHHTKLIADVMTRTGTITPMTRNGLQNSTDSVCRLLFEDVLENIKKGGAFAQKDQLKGVPECVLMGICAPIGTGAVHLAKAEEVKADELKAGGKNKDKNEFVVVGGAREKPCRSRPFRFFQQFVPVSRGVQLQNPTLKSTWVASISSILINPSVISAQTPLCETSAPKVYDKVPVFQRKATFAGTATPIGARNITITNLRPETTNWDYLYPKLNVPLFSAQFSYSRYFEL